MSGEHRHLWRIVFRNFINSFKPRQIQGNHMGTDYIGNKYYEIPSDPSAGKRIPKRWYTPTKGREFDDQIPSEWESWLRQRRKEPPSVEEIQKNLAIAQMKKENAEKIELKRLAEGGSLPVPPPRGPETFPKYEEYDTTEPFIRRKKLTDE